MFFRELDRYGLVRLINYSNYACFSHGKKIYATLAQLQDGVQKSTSGQTHIYASVADKYTDGSDL